MRRFSGRLPVEVGAFRARLNPEVHRQVASNCGRCRPDLQVGAIYTSSFETGQKRWPMLQLNTESAEPEGGKSMRIEEIMTSRVVTVRFDDTLSTVKEIVDAVKFHHLLFVEDGELQGVVSDRDLLRAMSPFYRKCRRDTEGCWNRRQAAAPAHEPQARYVAARCQSGRSRQALSRARDFVPSLGRQELPAGWYRKLARHSENHGR